MNSFYEHHKHSIRFHYRCFDRILLNGLIQPFQQPERVIGFFDAYRQLYPVSRDTLRGIADGFQQWLKSWSAKRNVPILDAPKGRRDEFVEPYFKGAEPDEVVVVLKAREPARIMTTKFPPPALLKSWPQHALQPLLRALAAGHDRRVASDGSPVRRESLTLEEILREAGGATPPAYSPRRSVVHMSTGSLKSAPRRVGADWREQAGGQRSVNASFEELKKDKAD